MGLLDNIDPMSLLMGGTTMMANARGRNSRQAIPMGLEQFAQYQMLAQKQKQEEEDRKQRQEQLDMQKKLHEIQLGEYQRKIDEQQKQKAAMGRLLGGMGNYIDQQDVPVESFQNVPRTPQQGAVAPDFGLDKQSITTIQKQAVPNAARYTQDITDAGFGDEMLKRQLFPAGPEAMIAPDGTVINKNDPNIIGKNFAKPEESAMNPNKPFMVVDGKVVPNKAYQDYEINKAKAGATKLSVGGANILPEKFTDKLNALAAERLMGQFDEGRNASTALSAVKDAKTLLDRGMFTGKLGPYQESVSAWYQGLTGKKLDALDATQQFRTVIGDIVLPALSNLKGASSDRDFIKIEEYSRGAADMTETALKSHLDRLYNKYNAQLKNFNKGYSDYKTSGGVDLPGVKPFDEPSGNISANQAPVKIKNDAEYNALPSGTLFIDPFGKQRRKP